jgi:hypothetical protein
MSELFQGSPSLLPPLLSHSIYNTSSKKGTDRRKKRNIKEGDLESISDDDGEIYVSRCVFQIQDDGHVYEPISDGQVEKANV